MLNVQRHPLVPTSDDLKMVPMAVKLGRMAQPTMIMDERAVAVKCMMMVAANDFG